jgi:hypothetical protein
MIRQRFARTEGLREADGVEIRETRYFQGTVRVTGTVARQEQIETVRRTLESLRAALGSKADAKINTFDLTYLKVKAPGKLPAPKAEPAPRTEQPPTGESGTKMITEPMPWPGHLEVDSDSHAARVGWWLPPAAFLPPPPGPLGNGAVPPSPYPHGWEAGFMGFYGTNFYPWPHCSGCGWR